VAGANRKSELKREEYKELLEEARYRDSLLVQVFSIFTVAVSLIVVAWVNVLGIATATLPADNKTAVIAFIVLLGWSLVTVAGLSLQRIGGARNAAWAAAKELEKDTKLGLSVSSKLEHSFRLSSALGVLGPTSLVWSWMFNLASVLLLADAAWLFWGLPSWRWMAWVCISFFALILARLIWVWTTPAKVKKPANKQ